jgi:hypothetical protein
MKEGSYINFPMTMTMEAQPCQRVPHQNTGQHLSVKSTNATSIHRGLYRRL